jgi:hypothetical protein
MKRLIFATMMLAASLSAFAQKTKEIIYSAPFEEPDGLESKVIQCSNGNTFLFTFTHKDGIETTVYNSKHEQTSKQLITSEKWDIKKMKKVSIDGIYEINGDLVMFLEQLDDRKPTLYRIVINSENGNVKSEKLMATLDKYGFGAGYSMLFGGVQPKGFHVSKDPASDNYAIVGFDGFSSETEGRIELWSFNGEHKQTAHSNFNSPEKAFKYVNFVAMTVVGDATVLCTYAYNKKAPEGERSRLILSKLKAGTDKLEHKILETENDMQNTSAMMLYNPGEKVLELLSISLVTAKKGGFFSSGATSYYALFLNKFDVESLALLRSIPVGVDKLAEYGASRWGKSGAFRGMPMDMMLKPDNTVSIVFEESIVTTITNGRTTTTSIELGKMGLLEFDAMGNDRDGFVVRKSQTSRNMVLPMSLNTRHNNRVDFDAAGGGFGSAANSGFYSFDFINTASGSYFIFNDLPRNYDLEDSKAPKTLASVSESNTVCYALKNGEWKRKNLFGTPIEDNINRFAFISSGDYNSKTGLYATLMIEKTGRKKETHIAWIPFE